MPDLIYFKVLSLNVTMTWIFEDSLMTIILIGFVRNEGF